MINSPNNIPFPWFDFCFKIFHFLSYFTNSKWSLNLSHHFLIFCLNTEKKNYTLTKFCINQAMLSFFCNIPQYIQDPKQDIGYPVTWALSQKMYMKWSGSWLEHNSCSLNVNALLWCWSIHAMRWQESSVPLNSASQKCCRAGLPA